MKPRHDGTELELFNIMLLVVCRSGNVVSQINEVALNWAPLVLR